jgi:hypothetical protein
VPEAGDRRTVQRVRLDGRQKAYLLLRAGAALVFLVAATVLPHGVPAGLCVIAAGLVAILSCIGVNAGGPGEQAGAAREDAWFRSVRAPQGDWPPFDPDRVVEGELVERHER